MEQKNESPNLPTTVHAAEPRHDGWTWQRQEAFLKALAACGCVREACAALGMSHVSAYKLRARPSAIAFRAAWEAALDCGLGRVEDGAVSRSVHGVARPIFYKGEHVGEWRHHDERLTMFLLRYRRPHRYGSQLDHLPPPPPALRPPGMDDEPDEDEAMGRLDWLLEELIDFGDVPCLAEESSRAMDGGNFGNFTSNDEERDSTTRPPGLGAPEIDGELHLRDAAGLKPGDIVPVKIEDSDEHDLHGVPV